MDRHQRFRRCLAVALAAGLILSMVGAAEAPAKAKACKKGFVRNKARKCVRRKAVATTVKRATTTAKPTAAPSGAVKKGTIKLGTLGVSVNGTTGAATADEIKKLAPVWASMVNSNGGINGYKVELIYRDTKADSARALSVAKELDAAGVLAVIGNGDPAGMSAVMPYANDKNIPFIGGGSYRTNCVEPMQFPVSGCYQSVSGYAFAAKDAGATNLRYAYCVESQACGDSVPFVKYGAQHEGLKFSSESASAVAVDYTATCLSARAAGADYIQIAGLNFANLVRDCSRQGYHPAYAVGGGGSLANIDASKGETLAGSGYEGAGFNVNNPEWAEFRSLLAQTDLSYEKATLSIIGIKFWLAAKMTEEIIKNLTQPNPTRADFLEATYRIKNNTAGGLLPPLDYSVQRPGTGKHAANDCWTEYIVKDGQYFNMNRSGQAVNKITWICGTGLNPESGKLPTF